MNEELINAFELCWMKITEGATVEECLQEHPDIADDLQPYLETAIKARSLSVSEVPTEVFNRSRTRLLGQVAQLRRDKPVARGLFLRFPFVVLSAVLLALVLILGSRELVVVSAESLPGDSLYPIKRAVQDIRVRFAPNQELKHEIESQYRDQRIDEVVNLLAVGRIEMVSFDGVVDNITPTRWIVDGINVILTEKTLVIGDISLGSLIEVEGLTSPEGWIEAHELHLREYEFVGQVETIDFNFWMISNIKFEIISSTQIDSGVQVGDDVLVLARTQDDESQNALAIIRLPSYVEYPDPSSGNLATLTEGKNVGDELEFSGKVEYIASSYWVIDGYTVMISLLTEVKEEINLGDFVKVHAFIGEDGSIISREVELVSDDAVQDKNDDGLEDEMLEDEQESDDDSNLNTQDEDHNQRDDQEYSNDNKGTDDENDDTKGEEDGGDNSGSSEPEDDSTDDGSGGSGVEEESTGDDELDGDVESDELENNLEQSVTEMDD